MGSGDGQFVFCRRGFCFVFLFVRFEEKQTERKKERKGVKERRTNVWEIEDETGLVIGNCGVFESEIINKVALSVQRQNGRGNLLGVFETRDWIGDVAEQSVRCVESGALGDEEEGVESGVKTKSKERFNHSLWQDRAIEFVAHHEGMMKIRGSLCGERKSKDLVSLFVQALIDGTKLVVSKVSQFREIRVRDADKRIVGHLRQGDVAG